MSIACRNNRTTALPAPLLGAHYPLTRKELVADITVLLLATYLLTPRFWEPGGETWKHWAAARILRETGGFPVFTLGPVYIAYLQLFLFLDYPQSLQIEYLVTHLFCYMSIFLMLRSFLSSSPALTLTCAWIPVLGVVESSATVAGIGFLALYFRKRSPLFRQGYFPSSLGAAALCHAGYVAFFVGHILGALIERFRKKQAIPCVSSERKRTERFPLLLNGGFLLLIVLTVFFPSNRTDHNHALIDPTYTPIPLRDPVTISFIQNGNWKYVLTTTPESSWIYQDWYLTNEKAFGGATTIFRAVLNKPDRVAHHLLDNLRAVANVPATFLGGPVLPQLGSWLLGGGSWGLFLISLVGTVKSYENNEPLPRLCAITVGMSAAVVSLSLTMFALRYVVTLLPIGLLMVVHVWPGLSSLTKSILEKGAGRNSASTVTARSREERIGVICGASLVLVGIICNEWILVRIFSSDGMLVLSTRMTIWFLEGLLITGGVALIRYRHAFGAMLMSKDFRVANAIVLISAGCVLLTAAFPHGKTAQLRAVLKNQAFLSGAEPVSMVAAHQQLLANLSEKTSVLALEDTWIKAFAKVDLNKVVNVFSLPPFPDPSGNTEQMLEGLDVIGVSINWADEKPSIGMQTFVRYRLHVEPFLETATARGWSVEVIDGYGKLYRRPASR